MQLASLVNVLLAKIILYMELLCKAYLRESRPGNRRLFLQLVYSKVFSPPGPLP